MMEDTGTPKSCSDSEHAPSVSQSDVFQEGNNTMGTPPPSQSSKYQDIRITQAQQESLNAYNELNKMEFWLPAPTGAEWLAFQEMSAEFALLPANFNCEVAVLEKIKAKLGKEFSTWLAKTMTGLLRHKRINHTQTVSVDIMGPMHQYYLPWMQLVEHLRNVADLHNSSLPDDDFCFIPPTLDVLSLIHI